MKAFDFVVCVPARFASTRLPGKPLIKLKGKELILWAVEAASQLGAKEVVVATDNHDILNLVQSNGHQAVMTDASHQSGTDRIAQCAKIMDWDKSTWVLNYQGDEPNIPKANVNQVIELVKAHPTASIGTLYQRIENIRDLFNPNVVKLVTDNHQRALYFSRAPIPWSQTEFQLPLKDNQKLPLDIEYKHHVGLYMYTVDFLQRFSKAGVVNLECTESLEQLRAMAMGDVIVAAKAIHPMPRGIDTPADVVDFEALES